MVTCSSEALLVGEQAKSSVGIFACDGHAVVTNSYANIQNTVMLVVKSTPVGVSSDGTAANTRQFIEAWNAVLKQGDFEYHDWTLKVDPDALVLPDRIREHLRPATLAGNGEDMQYVANCNAYPNTPGFPMMYGSLEVFSRKAIIRFGKKSKERCVDGLQWKDWGEDVFMVACMHVLDISRMDDFSLIGDNLCTGNGHAGADCGNRALASFHPFKDIWSWTRCFETATGVPLQIDTLQRKRKRLRKLAVKLADNFSFPVQ
jgi:hypothetical protein